MADLPQSPSRLGIAPRPGSEHPPIRTPLDTASRTSVHCRSQSRDSPHQESPAPIPHTRRTSRCREALRPRGSPHHLLLELPQKRDSLQRRWIPRTGRHRLAPRIVQIANTSAMRAPIIRTHQRVSASVIRPSAPSLRPVRGIPRV